MNWRIPNENVNALLIVAHPDDETIFCGGIMLTYPRWNWTVIHMTHDESSERHIEFSAAIQYFKDLGVNIISNRTLNKEDVLGRDLIAGEITDWKESLKNLNLTPDIVFTHNTEGEYGHNHHRVVNAITNQLFENVWEFICPGARNISPQPFKEENNVVPLSMEILNQKTEIFNRKYTSQLNCWREISDIMVYEFKTGPEIFTSNPQR